LNEFIENVIFDILPQRDWEFLYQFFLSDALPSVPLVVKVLYDPLSQHRVDSIELHPFENHVFAVRVIIIG